MKKILTYMLLAFAVFAFTNCTKDEDDPIVLPTLDLKAETGYISQNTNAAFGDTLLFGVIAKSNGKDNLVKFKVEVNDQLLLDSTINTAEFNFDFYTIKGISNVEEWTMTVTDIAGNSFNKTVTITAEFGEINSFTAILMGAQDNAEVQSFLSLSDNLATLYFQAQAFENQEDIDMFCFFENNEESQNMMSLAAPGTGIDGIFSGQTAPENYTIKNTTYFCKTNLTAAEFDAVENDAVVLDSYDPENKFRKAKLLTEGDVYSFKLQSGLFGLFKVISVDGEETGTLELAIKVQKQQ
jgi:hypothetical protein